MQYIFVQKKKILGKKRYSTIMLQKINLCTLLRFIFYFFVENDASTVRLMLQKR